MANVLHILENTYGRGAGYSEPTLWWHGQELLGQ